MKKEILFVIESLNCGGAEKSLLTLLNNLDYSRVDASLLLFNRGGSFEKFLTKEVKIIYHTPLDIDNVKNIWGRIKFWLLRKTNFKKKMHISQLFWKSMKNYISGLEGNYQIAIAYNQGFSTYFVSQLVNSDKKYAWMNTDYIKAGYNPSFDYRFYKSFHKIIAVSPQSRDSFVGSMKGLGEDFDVEVIKDIVDKDTIRSMGKESPLHSFDDACINLVTVARMTTLKGLLFIPESCRKLIDKGHNVHWYIVGEGAERKNIEYLIRKLNLEKNITLVGFTDNPYPYIRMCDIYVQTSLYEGLGLSVIEATLLNKPVVTTNFTTASSIVRHGQTGLICQMNSEDIARHIEMFIKDEKLRTYVCLNLNNREIKDKEISLGAFYSLVGL